jgi:hypothetical protein
VVLTIVTDLPEQLRFGRVEVSCEGWSRPGDPMVLKGTTQISKDNNKTSMLMRTYCSLLGSCGLEYRLLRIPSAYTTSDDVPGPFQRLMRKYTS